jgi:hypothetical protein
MSDAVQAPTGRCRCFQGSCRSRCREHCAAPPTFVLHSPRSSAQASARRSCLLGRSLPLLEWLEGKSLPTQTQWRWGELRGNWSLGVERVVGQPVSRATAMHAGARRSPTDYCPRTPTRLPACGVSPGRTRLSARFPDVQGKYREISRFQALAGRSLSECRVISNRWT